jgi:flagellar biogenesis protein FliO
MIRSAAGPARRVARLAPLTFAFAAAPAAAQRLGQGTGTDLPLWRVLLALAFCLALGIAAVLLLRRRYRGARPLTFGRERRLQLVENLRLSHQVDLCIVSRDGHEYLITSGPQGVTLVDRGPFEVSSVLPAAPPPGMEDGPE